MATESEHQALPATNAGVRVVGKRIYDPNNGKTCHQCRQKTRDRTASCKFMKKHRVCPMKYCHKCLVNRYGEKVEEVDLLPDWSCPKCRGICNCSLCMKKKGHQPTGMLVHTAKATGFASVSELLQAKGPENFSYYKSTKLALQDDLVSSGEAGFENPLEGESESQNEQAPVNTEIDEEGLMEVDVIDGYKQGEEESGGVNRNKTSLEVPEGSNEEVDVAVEMCDIGGVVKQTENVNKEEEIEVPLPQGNHSSITLSGIDVPPEYVGNVLQFFEFCSAFDEILEVTKEIAECAIREIFGDSKTRQQHSVVIKFMIQLLCILLEDRGEIFATFYPTDDAWFNTLGDFVAEAKWLSDEFPAKLFQKGLQEYTNLDVSRKLKLLNFICDESLCTTVMRNFIDYKDAESADKKKEAKEKLAAAKRKEKLLKKKVDEETAKAILGHSGESLSMTEREAIVTNLKIELAEARAEVLEAIAALSKTKQRSDAMRTDPVLVDGKGHTFWSLKSYTEEPSLLLQDNGTSSEDCPNGKWLTFTSEQQPELEKYISSAKKKQKKKRRARRNTRAPPVVRLESEANPNPETS